MKSILDIINRLKYYVIRKTDVINAQFQWYLIRKRSKLSVMTSIETIQYIIENRCSVSRFGDGEFSIIFHEEGPGFQNTTNELSIKLREVFSNRSSKLLICIPRFLIDSRELNKTGKDYWRNYAIQKQDNITKMLRDEDAMAYHFGDSYISRPFTPYKSQKNTEIVFSLLKDLWNARNLLIVEGSQTRLGVNNDLFQNVNSIKRIIVPAQNAFDHYQEILEETVRQWEGQLVLLAIGPTATVLASDLCKQGIQAIDIGHIDIQYEWYQRNDPWKVVPGKYINELREGRVVEACLDIEYLSQIVKEL